MERNRRRLISNGYSDEISERSNDMDCLVMYWYRGSRSSALIHEANENNWFDKFRSQNSYDEIISHMFIG
jgi:hypothetical protein